MTRRDRAERGEAPSFVTENPTNGQPSPWSRDDVELFKDDEKRCAACDEPFLVGQEVQERPAFSLRFYHVSPRDCLTHPEEETP